MPEFLSRRGVLPAAFVISLSLPLVGQAQENESPATSVQEVEPVSSPYSFLVGAGLTAGGDNLLKVWYEDGSSDKIYAGGLLDLKLGMTYQTEGSNFGLQSTVGYFFDSVDAENADGSFSRIPLELLAFYTHKKHRFATGISYHTSVNFEFKGLGEDVDVDFDPATGVVLEYAYQATPKVSFALRGVSIEYTPKSNGGEDVDGSHAGLYGYLHF